MRLKNINIKREDLTDDNIQNIVYDGIEDSGLSTTYGIVFGNSNLIKERVITAVKAYQTKRIKKVIFCGGTDGVSNENNDVVAEAIKMKSLAIERGIKEEDILVDDKSNNSFENVDNAFSLIGESNIDSIAIITSEFHLKRCMAIIKKRYPEIEVIMIHSRDGYSDSDNWYNSKLEWNSGRSLATFEADILIKYAKEDKIANIDIVGIENRKRYLKN